jgi:hypothetical protein
VLFEEDIALLPPPLAADFIIELLNNWAFIYKF